MNKITRIVSRLLGKPPTPDLGVNSAIPDRKRPRLAGILRNFPLLFGGTIVIGMVDPSLRNLVAS